MPVTGPQCSSVRTNDRQLDALHLVHGVVLSSAVESPATEHVQPPVVDHQPEVADSSSTATVALRPVAGLRVEQAIEIGADDDDSVVVRYYSKTSEV